MWQDPNSGSQYIEDPFHFPGTIGIKTKGQKYGSGTSGGSTIDFYGLKKDPYSGG